MRVSLSEIKGSTPRVRQSQSPEKLEELAESIREEGVIVPVKLRKNGSGYVLVYGHRRVAAAKMAGLKEIEAIVEDVPEKKLLTQALIENVVREDMPAIEIAKALRGILNDTGCTQDELGKKFGWAGEQAVGRYLAMLAPELGLEQSEKPHARGVSAMHVQEAKAGTHGDLKLAGRVLEKAGEEELSARETRQYAEVVGKASEFGGAKAVKSVFAQPTKQVLDAADWLPPRKVPVVVRKAEGVRLFEWLKSPRVILAEEGMKLAKELVSEIVHSEEDRGGGKAVIRRIVALADEVAKAGRKALERMQ